MMRKLAVTVFVFSLAAMGCGSDNGTPNKADTSVAIDGPAVKLDVNKDVPASPDAPGTPDLAIDQAQGAETQLPGVDAPATEAGQLGEVGKPEVKAPVDTQGVDQGKTNVDGGTTTVDSGTTVDGGAAVDTGSVG